MRALLIANGAEADAGFVGDRLRHHGYAFAECHRERPGDWPDLDGHELVLLLGSEWSVYWPQVADNVRAEAALVRSAHERGVPMLGICFGHQTMSHALGGTVERASRPEIGWYDVVSDVPEWIAPGPWLQWHYDVVTVPPGATELARTSVGPQSWRLGRSCTTQFHPEATEAMLARWTSGVGTEELAQFGTSPEAIMADTRANVGVSREHADVLVDRFLEDCAGR